MRRLEIYSRVLVAFVFAIIFLIFYGICIQLYTLVYRAKLLQGAKPS